MDTADQADALNDLIGPTQGPNGPATRLLALFDADPAAGGVEAGVDCPGYARVSVAKADWDEATAADPVKRTTDLVQFPDVTGEWARTMTYWGL
ncbi:MAG TPA: hypothetical protein VFO98_15540, partial [Marmoricola sp.]|nr:hypothetical protein [Marmoricola sp.]